MRVLLFVALLLANVSLSQSAEKPWPEPDVAFFTKLRMDFAKRPDFDSMWKMDDERSAIMAAAKAKDHAKVVALSEPWLKKCPVDADVHYLCAQSLTVLGEIRRYAQHLYYFYGLLQSIVSTGDGKSPKTAFKVISVAEEYYLLNDFGAEVVSQGLQDKCDVMQCKLNGKEVTYYFDVSISLAAQARMFSPKK